MTVCDSWQNHLYHLAVSRRGEGCETDFGASPACGSLVEYQTEVENVPTFTSKLLIHIGDLHAENLRLRKG